MKVKGEVHYKVFEHGKLIAEHTERNLVVDLGKESLAKLLTNDDNTRYISRVGFGEGNTPPSSLDASLTNQFLKAVDSFDFPTVNQARFQFTCALNECNGMTIREFGLFSNDPGNTMFARRLALSPIVKTNAISIQGNWTITF